MLPFLWVPSNNCSQIVPNPAEAFPPIQRKAGELLAGMDLNKISKLESNKTQLSDLSITGKQSSRWQRASLVGARGDKTSPRLDSMGITKTQSSR